MVDKGKVIKGWECHMEADTLGCADCPYREGWRTCNFADTLYKDVYAMLKEQEEEIESLKQTCQSMMEGVCLLKEHEAVEPLPQNSNGWVRTIKLWYCGACHSKISRRTSKYCPNCGKPISWKDR